MSGSAASSQFHLSTLTTAFPEATQRMLSVTKKRGSTFNVTTELERKYRAASEMATVCLAEIEDVLPNA